MPSFSLKKFEIILQLPLTYVNDDLKLVSPVKYPEYFGEIISRVLLLCVSIFLASHTLCLSNETMSTPYNEQHAVIKDRKPVFKTYISVSIQRQLANSVSNSTYL